MTMMFPSAEEAASDHSPRMEARRQAMIEAAAAVFSEMGYERASLGAIVRRSGGSLSTLYQLFGSKEGLFEAMVQAKCRQIMEPLMAADLCDRNPRDTLSAIADVFLRIILAPEAQALWRMVMGEGLKFPLLPEIYFRCGPDPVQAAVARYLADLHQRGVLHCPDTRICAQSFCMLVHGDLYYRVVTGTRPPPDDAELKAHIDQIVELFLRMLAPAR